MPKLTWCSRSKDETSTQLSCSYSSALSGIPKFPLIMQWMCWITETPEPASKFTLVPDTWGCLTRGCQIILALMSKETGTNQQSWKQMNRPQSKLGLTRCTETSMKKENFQSSDPTEIRLARFEWNIGIRLRGVELSLHLIFPLRFCVLKTGTHWQASQNPTSMPESSHDYSVTWIFWVKVWFSKKWPYNKES